MEQLTIDEMLPHKMNVLINRHFIVHLDGLDYFMIKSIERNIEQKTLVVKLHDVLAPNAEHQITEILKEQNKFLNKVFRLSNRQLRFRKIDPVGNVVVTKLYSGVRIIKTQYPKNDCDSLMFGEIVLTLSYKKETCPDLG